MTEILPPQSSITTPPPKGAQSQDVRQVAVKLEATFLAEMLKAAGFGEQENSFSGGSGEDQFASFHRQAIADKIAAAGGIGLAEHIVKALLENKNGT